MLLLLFLTLITFIYGVDMEKLSPMERTKAMAKFEKYMQRSASSSNSIKIDSWNRKLVRATSRALHSPKNEEKLLDIFLATSHHLF